MCTFSSDTPTQGISPSMHCGGKRWNPGHPCTKQWCVKRLFMGKSHNCCSEKTGSCVNHSDFTKTYRIMKALVSNPVQKAMHQATSAEQGTGRDWPEFIHLSPVSVWLHGEDRNTGPKKASATNALIDTFHAIMPTRTVRIAFLYTFEMPLRRPESYGAVSEFVCQTVLSISFPAIMMDA